MVRKRWWCGAMVLGLVFGCARQAVPEYPPLASSERQASTGEVPVRILELRTEFKFDDKGNWEQRTTQKYRILNRAGVESWGSTGAAWSPWYMARPEIHAQVQDPGGALRELDPKVIAESSASPDLPDMYGDRRVLRAPLPGVQVGSIVTESMVSKTTRPFFTGGASFQINFQTAIPRDKVELIIDLPEKLPFQYDVRDLLVVRAEAVKDGRRRVVFRGENYGAVKPVDDYAPSNVAAWPSVVFSTGESWQKIAAAYEDVMDEKLKGAAGVAELARRSVKPGASPIEQANQLLYALHERVRYAAVEFGQAAIIPTTPAETLQRTFGDCKDQSLVLVAMLRAVGLPATLALLRAGPGEDVHPRMPALAVFDHAIVVVRGEQPFWIDPTSDLARAGELPAGDQGRLALIIDDDTRDLSLIPTMSASQNTYLETREIRLQESGPSRIVETSSSSGLLEQRMRGSFASSDQERAKDLLEYVKRFYDADKLVSSKFDGFEDTRQPARLSLEATSQSFGASDLFVASVPIDQSLVYSYLPRPFHEREDDEPPRKGDLILPARYQAEVRYHIVPPPRFKTKKLPVVAAVDMGPAKLTRQYRVAADGSVDAAFKLEIDKLRLSPADQAAIRAGLEAIEEEPRDTVELEHEAVLAFETGQPAQGMKVMREQAQTEPKAVAPLLRWAFKLSELGFGRQAREKLRAALALEPNSNLVQRSAGFILVRDEHGRWLKPGYDRQGAIAAQRRAAELDPKDVFAKTELAVLLEYDEKGKRYANAAGVDEALGLYDSIPDEDLKAYENGDFRWNALYLLLNVERYGELRERLTKLKADDVPPNLPLTLEALEKGVPAALSLADSQGLRGEPRAQALVSAAGTLYEKRQYPGAAALFEEASKNSSAETSKYSTLARIIRQTSRIDVQQAKQDSPEALVRKAVLLAVASEDLNGGSALKKLLSSRATQSKSAQTPTPEASTAASAVDASSVPRAVLVDTTAGMMKVTVEGDDPTGYRVKAITSGLDNRTSTSTYYVVKEGTAYLIRAVDERGALGCEALYLQKKHAEKAAKQWLSWAAEAAGEGYGDDPLRAAPFVRLWSAGKGNAELAALALCADSGGGKEARQALLKRRVKAGPDASAIEHAIAESAGHDLNHELQLSAAEELLRLHPGSARARSYQVWALRLLKRQEQYEKALRAAIAEAKGGGRFRRSESLLELADLQAKSGKVAESRKTLKQVIDDGEAFDKGRAYNNSAWNALFLEVRPKEMLEHALQAVQVSLGDKYSSLHTLGCVYLDQGNVVEAQRVFDKLLEIDKLPALRDATRYLQGGLAEAYGLVEEARLSYQSVEAPKDPYPTATYMLAQRRLRALDKVAKAK